MGCSSQSLYMISASTHVFPSQRFLKKSQKLKPNCTLLRIRASSNAEDDCNDEECAPDKEVGKISVEWLAGEKTKVVGTFPPRRRGWTGYVEKDTAGQTNIYSVEPAVYVAESAISSGSGGASADGSENTIAVAAGLTLLFVAAASSILFQVGKNPPQVQSLNYSGPSLSYYINKFKPPETIEASVATQSENTATAQLESSAPEAPQVQVGLNKADSSKSVLNIGDAS
ncbi:hypothetical protein Scep_014508 [Stephania cephalantha]|uniref:Protein MAINTENANCE OF PSII UNDER HIGH LIGHT 1 n=1 Tax=Stephania cephalantha TaxID=152367 RepID=A0AAP0NZG3_9MAGN